MECSLPAGPRVGLEHDAAAVAQPPRRGEAGDAAADDRDVVDVFGTRCRG